MPLMRLFPLGAQFVELLPQAEVRVKGKKKDFFMFFRRFQLPAFFEQPRTPNCFGLRFSIIQMAKLPRPIWWMFDRKSIGHQNRINRRFKEGRKQYPFRPNYIFAIDGFIGTTQPLIILHASFCQCLYHSLFIELALSTVGWNWLELFSSSRWPSTWFAQPPFHISTISFLPKFLPKKKLVCLLSYSA